MWKKLSQIDDSIGSTSNPQTSDQINQICQARARVLNLLPSHAAMRCGTTCVCMCTAHAFNPVS